MSIKILFCFLTLFSFEYAYAYKSSKCNAFIDRHNGLGVGWAMSTTSYISSIGPCAMIGMLEHDKQVFIAHNFDNLMKESAQGRGEYLQAFATIAGCDGKSKLKLPNSFQQNFKMIYEERADKDVEKVYRAINEVLKNDPILSIGCGIKS